MAAKQRLTKVKEITFNSNRPTLIENSRDDKRHVNSNWIAFAKYYNCQKSRRRHHHHRHLPHRLHQQYRCINHLPHHPNRRWHLVRKLSACDPRQVYYYLDAFKESKGRAPGYATTSQHKDGASKQSSANSSDFETMGIQLDDLSTKKDDIVDEEAKEVPPDDPQIVLPSKLKKSAIHHL